MSLRKINIQFLGQRRYLAQDVDEAKKMALNDLQNVSSNLNLEINGYMDLGIVVSGEEE